MGGTTGALSDLCPSPPPPPAAASEGRDLGTRLPRELVKPGTRNEEMGNDGNGQVTGDA